MSLTIKRIEVLNIGGIEKYIADLGAINIIEGQNGSGKTSLMQAMVGIFEGGHDSFMLRRLDLDEDGVMETPCEKGEIILTLSDDTKITKEITAFESILTITTPDGGTKGAPATFLKTLLPPSSFDPIGFLNSAPKDKSDFLLKTLPLTFEAHEVNMALAGFKPGKGPAKVVPMTERAKAAVKQFEPPKVVSESVTLQKLNELRKGRYDQRTEISRQCRDLEGTIRDAEATLPEKETTDWKAVEKEAQEEIRENDETIGSLESSIDLAAADAAKAARYQAGLETQQWDSEITTLQNQISELRAKRTQRIEELKTREAEIEGNAEKEKRAGTQELQMRRITLNSKLSGAQSKIALINQAEGVRNLIAERTKKLKETTENETSLTAAITAIDALKNEKLKLLPVPGLDLITDSKNRPVIMIDGLPLEKLNRQRQLYVAISLVKLASGKLPLIFCECAELDTEHLHELGEAAKEAGIQLIVARWSDGQPLTVKEG